MLDTSKIYSTKRYGKLKVINYIKASEVVVEFINTGYITTTQTNNILIGSVKDKRHPSIYGVGFVGGDGYYPSINRVNTKAYTAWSCMLRRCYSSEYQLTHPTYTNCSVCDAWHDFQNFAHWFYLNCIDGYHLDKDIKQNGVKNKIYSPSTCLFVPQKSNNIKAAAKTHKFKSPVGEIIYIYNLAEFCRNNSLGISGMSQVILGNQNHHKGWTKA